MGGFWERPRSAISGEVLGNLGIGGLREYNSEQMERLGSAWQGGDRSLGSARCSGRRGLRRKWVYNF